MEYRVLARKYRPATFADLIGQEMLVRTLSNAIRAGRIHHAFVLMGIRGVGKTTTARIIARGLNCEKGPTPDPCGVCANCLAIAEDRHMDVLEMDAASRTGVNDIRELIDTVHYAPVSARYKIYIIDEVHMLSTSAFNALLKTLEEPPPHVKFIFATTEARKIPVTILSRCQRFDLKRVEADVLAAHLGNISGKEGVDITPEALSLLSQAAEGSVRDALSLLDQAIAHEAKTEAEVRTMIGLADRSQTLTLLETLLEGDMAGSLSTFRAMYEGGADPLLTLQDLLDLTYFITRIRLVPEVANDLAYAEHERKRSQALAGKLSMPVLTRLWQMLLKAHNEARFAPNVASAVEMALVRAAYASELPTPAEAIRSLEKSAGNMVPAEKKTPDSGGGRGEGRGVSVQLPTLNSPPSTLAIADFPSLIAALENARELLLAGQLRQFGSLVHFTQGELEVAMKCHVDRQFAPRIAAVLSHLTGREWKVMLSENAGDATLHEQEMTRKKQELTAVSTHPLVASVLEHFPGAELVDIKEPA